MSLATLFLLLLSPCHLLAISCNFETVCSEWEQNANASLQWIRDSGRESNLLHHGPNYDHTLNGKGYYLFVNNTTANGGDRKARYTSILQTATSGNQCFSFWYHMYGPDIGTLSLKLQQGQSEELLWTRTGTHGNQWRRGFHTIPPQNQHFQLIFEAIPRGITGDISIDDVSVVGGACEAEEMCSFEANSCQYTSTGMQRWQRLSGDRENSSNRPVTDHTTETTQGHFMLADTSHAVLPIRKAVLLVSPLHESRDSGVCLQFWLQMNGESPGTLTIYVEGEREQREKVWSSSMSQGLTWSLIRVNIHTAHNWKFIFEAIGGGAEMSHIAIDDVTLDHKECPQIGTCDFERGLCGWKNVLNPKLDSKDWDWNNGQAPSYFKGPEVDHTLGTSQVHGVLKAFRYQTNQEIVIWEAKGSQSTEWQSVNITVESSVRFQVGFTAVKANSAEVGYVAIDDVVYSPGVNCHGVVTDVARSGSSHTAGIAAGVMIVLAMMGFLIVGIIYWLRKRRIPGSSSGPNRQFGFDNLFYRNHS
ncbi:apical endosomal glycoprotein-like isoform X2 [Mustelus asterias]